MSGAYLYTAPRSAERIPGPPSSEKNLYYFPLYEVKRSVLKLSRQFSGDLICESNDLFNLKMNSLYHGLHFCGGMNV